MTRSQADMVAAIRTLRTKNDQWPSGMAIARALGLNVTGVRRRLKRLERLGVILWAGGDVRIARQPDGIFLSLVEMRR